MQQRIDWNVGPAAFCESGACTCSKGSKRILPACRFFTDFPSDSEISRPQLTDFSRKLARPEGFEPPTAWFVVSSIDYNLL